MSTILQADEQGHLNVPSSLLPAAVIAHHVDCLVTFNVVDFRSWPLRIVSPEDVLSIFTAGG